MSFVFQQPDSPGLLKTLDDCSNGAEGGGGLFAFASKGGIKTFFSLPNIAAMLKAKRPFHLVVGIDAITNAESILQLEASTKEYGPALKIHIFLHDQAPCTFHPKFAWFTRQGKLSLITGSGNLTERGLGKKTGGQAANWEAFSTQTLQGNDATSVQTQIADWLMSQAQAGTLYQLDAPRVLEKAMSNARVRYSVAELAPAKQKVTPVQKVPAKAAVVTQVKKPPLEKAEVLIRELPSTRGGQGDIGQDAHRHFFGHNGSDKNIFMQYVGLDNTLQPVRKVWLFYNPASGNYRLELPESKSYEKGPNDERMILVASKLDERSFRYTIVRPLANKSDYAKVSSLFPPYIKTGRRLMRENYLLAADLQTAWSDAPSNLLPIHLATVEP